MRLLSVQFKWLSITFILFSQLYISTVAMHLFNIYRVSIVLCASLLVCCSPSKKLPVGAAPHSIHALRFLGEKDVPYNLPYNNTTVGGLSGIDYDAVNKIYYLISDDRSAINAARFYTAKIDFTQRGIDSIYFTGVHELLQPNGASYPDSRKNPAHTPDPEAMRYNPISNQLVWSSEGERIVDTKDTVLENPSVITVSPDGHYKDSFALPPNLVMHATEKGPRQNGVLEGLSFADNYKTMFVNVEEPLYEDGPRADVTDNNAFVRILKFDVTSKQNTAQYAYKLEPVAYPASPTNAFKINGISDILSIGNNQLLTIERSFSTGRLSCTIKVFLTDLTEATDVTNQPLMNAGKYFTPAPKKLLLNMDNLGIYIDNIEGVTFGPDLPNGHKSLLFISDNNFNAFEKTQLLLFEVE